MLTFPNSPRLHKAAIVLRYAESSAVRRVVMLTCNSDMLTRTLQSWVVVPGGLDK
jgi:hypothetical protein